MLTILIAGPVLPVILYADGRYRILQDENGIYFQTETEGGWYIPEEDQSFFKPGQSGVYRIGRDENGSYLETEQGIFYLGYHDSKAHEQKIEAFNRAQNPSQTPDSETEVLVFGQHVIVPVQIKHQGRSIDLNLLLDTGASIITLHKNAVKRLRLPKGKTAHFTTAAGHVITADLVELQDVRFGPYHQSNLLAGVIEYQQNGVVNYDGLLGMNALKGINFRVDYENQTIHWFNEPNS